MRDPKTYFSNSSPSFVTIDARNLLHDIPSHKSSSSNRSLSTRKTTGSIIKKRINSNDTVANKEKKFSP